MAKFLHAAELKVYSPSDLWFLHPTPPDQPAHDTVIEGTVVLSLPTARKVKKLDVELIGRQNMFLLKRYEQYDTIRRKLTLNPSDGYGELPAGTHEFAWSFIVPSNTAPYERLDYGRTYHKVKATAYGCGRLGADLVADSGEIGIVNNSNQIGQAPAGFSADTETTHEVLGPLRVNLFSKYFLVSGYLRLALTLPAISSQVRLDDVTVVLKQDVLLRHMKDPSKEERQRPRRVLLWSLDEQEKGRILKEDEEWSIVRQMRLADDDTVRPSTNEWSETGIRVSHAIQVIIRFTALPSDWKSDRYGKSKDKNRDLDLHYDLDTKEMKISHPCSLSSCDCMLPNLQLPSYTLEDPSSSSNPTSPGGSNPTSRATSPVVGTSSSGPSMALYQWANEKTSHGAAVEAYYSSGPNGGKNVPNGYFGTSKSFRYKSECLCALSAKGKGKEEILKLYEVDPELLTGSAVQFGGSTESFRHRGRDGSGRGRWKDDETYGRELEDELRARSASRQRASHSHSHPGSGPGSAFNSGTATPTNSSGFDSRVASSNNLVAMMGEVQISLNDAIASSRDRSSRSRSRLRGALDRQDADGGRRGREGSRSLSRPGSTSTSRNPSRAGSRANSPSRSGQTTPTFPLMGLRGV